MSRTLPYLVELQPEPFCEVSPRLARERLLSLRLGDQVVEQVGLPYHWASNGLPPVTRGTTSSTSPWIRTCTSGQGRDLRHPTRTSPPRHQLTTYVADYRLRAGMDVYGAGG